MGLRGFAFGKRTKRMGLRDSKIIGDTNGQNSVTSFI